MRAWPVARSIFDASLEKREANERATSWIKNYSLQQGFEARGAVMTDDPAVSRKVGSKPINKKRLNRPLNFHF